jgi:type IV pilus assembly protein PilX
MARNQLDQQVARQAAESALRDAERDLYNIVTTPITNASCSRGGAIGASSFDASCTNGLCSMSDSAYRASVWNDGNGNQINPEPWWPTGKGGLWNNTFSNKPGRTPIDTNNCSFTGGVPLGTYTGAPYIRGVAIQPEYLIEYFKRSITGGKEINVYRITARGFGYTQRTQEVLQSIYTNE